MGQFGCGTVFKLTPDHHGSWTESVLHRFIGGKGGYGPSGVTFDKAGNLYGATIYDGLYGNGVVFMLTPTPGGSWRYKVLHQEIGTWDGYGDGLIFDHAENLYGAASFGGDLNYCEGFGCGTVFKLAPDAKGAWHETVLHTFRGKPGTGPGSLIFDAAGNLYGATSGHYAGNNGSLFEITP